MSSWQIFKQWTLHKEGQWYHLDDTEPREEIVIKENIYREKSYQPYISVYKIEQQ
jgi:hypothetical protein